MELLYIFSLLLIFFVAGINKIMNFNNTVNGLHTKFIFNELPKIISILVIGIVILIEIMCPVIMMYSTQNKKYRYYAIYSSLTLILFTVIATLYYHNPIVDPSQSISFMKNISIIGGLGLAMGHFYQY